jgi:hypothetical protein
MAINKLDIGDAGLNGDHVAALISLLACSFPLKTLSLCGNNGLKGKPLYALADALSRRKSLQRLDLSRTHAGDKALAGLLAAVCKLKHNFVALNVEACDLTPLAAQALGQFCQNNDKLLELRLSNNKLADKVCAETDCTLIYLKHSYNDVCRVLMHCCRFYRNHNIKRYEY